MSAERAHSRLLASFTRAQLIEYIGARQSAFVQAAFNNAATSAHKQITATDASAKQMQVVGLDSALRINLKPVYLHDAAQTLPVQEAKDFAASVNQQMQMADPETLSFSQLLDLAEKYYAIDQPAASDSSAQHTWEKDIEIAFGERIRAL